MSTLYQGHFFSSSNLEQSCRYISTCGKVTRFKAQFDKAYWGPTDGPEEHSLVILFHVILKMSLVVTFMDAKFWVPMAVVFLLLLNGHSEWLLSV